MKVALSLLMCISFTAIAMRHAPLRAMATQPPGRKPAAASQSAAARHTEAYVPMQDLPPVPGPRQPAQKTVNPAAAPAPRREEFLTNKQKHYLMEVGAADWGTFSPEQREKMIEAFRTLPLDKKKNNFAYNHALMTLAKNSARFTNLGEELPLAEALIEAGANIDYKVQVQENDCFGSMDGVSASAPYHYRTETLRTYARGDFEEMIIADNTKKSKI